MTFKKVILLLSIFVIFCCLHLAQAKTKLKPHVIFIMSDDHGYRDIGYHGSKFQTPVMDELAREGVKLENYYVQRVCTPTRSELLTGRYSIRTGLQHGVLEPDQPACLPLDEITLAQKLKETGYATHLVGKWHLGHYKHDCLAHNRGFDTFYGFLQGGEYFFSHDTPKGQLDLRLNDEPIWDENGTYSTHLFTDKAIDIINNHPADESLFLFLSYQAPHAPLEVPEEYKEPLRHLFDDERRLNYAAMTTCMDEGIGNVTKALKSAGLYENSVIIFSSDNGGATWGAASNWPLRGYKRVLFEGGIRAVGFVNSPLLCSKVRGTVNEELIHVTDWFPTIVKGIAGGSLSGTKPLDGINQWATIRIGFPTSRKEILHNIDPLEVISTNTYTDSPFNVSIEAAIREGDWKLHTGGDGRAGWYAPPDTSLETIIGVTGSDQVVWLFNIENDPLEMNDLSTQYPNIVKKLLKKLAKYQSEAVPVMYPPSVPDLANPCTNGNGCFWGPWV